MSWHLNPDDAQAYTRRRFIGTGLAFASASIAAPAFLQRSAYALPMPEPGASSIPGVPEDHILVVLQLSGGNDGLNTVVPFRDDNYARARPGIAIRERDVVELQRLGGGRATGLGLHPNLRSIKELYDDGLCSIVQGVGYPNPNRSHFKSMDIWHTADTNATGDGWLGRYFDSQCCGEGKGESGQAEQSGQPGVAIGRTAPLAMQGRKVKPSRSRRRTSSDGPARTCTTRSSTRTSTSPAPASARAQTSTRTPRSLCAPRSTPRSRAS